MRLRFAKSISLSRLRWLGHIYRRPDDEPVKKFRYGTQRAAEREAENALTGCF